MAALTSSVPRRLASGCTGAVAGWVAAINGWRTLLRTDGAEIGDASGINLALGESSAARTGGPASFGMPSVIPKKLAM
jgi:hypothetical protein